MLGPHWIEFWRLPTMASDAIMTFTDAAFDADEIPAPTFGVASAARDCCVLS